MAIILRLLSAIAVVALVSAHAACGQARPGAGADGDARETATRALLAQASKAVESFHAKNQRPPASIQELVAARLLHIQKSTDPWGQEFELVSQSHQQDGLEVCSAGPDTAPGTPDDICHRITF